MARPAADTTYYSDPFEVGEARSLAYWFQTLGSYPATVTNPATAHVETSNVLGFDPWEDLTPGAFASADRAMARSAEEPTKLAV